MRRAVLLMMFVGCGDDGGATMSDVLINPGPDYDLSCLGNMPASVPSTIPLMGTMYDMTGPMPMPLPNATIVAKTAQDDTEVGTGMTDMDGKFMFDVTTNGSAARIYMNATATGFVPAHGILNIPLYPSNAMGFQAMVKQSRIDELATSLGGTNDPAKGVLEVWVADCSKGELAQASLQLDGATVPWAMFGGVGVWIPRDLTLPHIQNVAVGSMAGTINVTPGLHTVTVSNMTGSLQLTGTINVQANVWNLLAIVPGAPL
jgi:hypothetical protein